MRPGTPHADGVDPRFPASAVPSITGLRLAPGGAVDLVNVSCSGMLVEGSMRLAPGTRLVVTVEGSFLPPRIKGRVVRCQVSSINAGTVRYQFAIEFDERLDEDSMPDGEEPAPDGTTAERPPTADLHASTPVRIVANRW